MLGHLQRLGMLKRAREPAPKIMLELLNTALDRIRCSACGHSGMALQEIDEQEWETTRKCAACGRPISAERLEALPDTANCAACAHAPDPAGDVDYCPKCGEVMSVVVGRGGGVTRYRLSCPACR